MGRGVRGGSENRVAGVWSSHEMSLMNKCTEVDDTRVLSQGDTVT